MRLVFQKFVLGTLGCLIFGISLAQPAFRVRNPVFFDFSNKPFLGLEHPYLLSNDLRIWDVEANAVVFDIENPKDKFANALTYRYLPNQNRLLLVWNSMVQGQLTLQELEIPSFRTLRTQKILDTKGQNYMIIGEGISDNGKYLTLSTGPDYVGGNPWDIELWDIDTAFPSIVHSFAVSNTQYLPEICFEAGSGKVAFLDHRRDNQVSIDILELPSIKKIYSQQIDEWLSNIYLKPDHNSFFCREGWGNYKLIDIATNKILLHYESECDIEQFLISPDGAYMAALLEECEDPQSGEDVPQALVIQELMTGAILWRYSLADYQDIGHKTGFNMAFSADGEGIAFLGTQEQKCQFEFWNWQSNTVLKKFDFSGDMFSRVSSNFYWEAQNSWVFSSFFMNSQGIVGIIDAMPPYGIRLLGHPKAKKEEDIRVFIKELKTDKKYLNNNVQKFVSPNGKWIGSVAQEEVELWDGEQNSFYANYTNKNGFQKGNVPLLAFDPTGSLLAMYQIPYQNPIIVLEAETGRQLASLSPGIPLQAVYFTGDSKFLVAQGTYSAGGVGEPPAEVWSTNNYEKVKTDKWSAISQEFPVVYPFQQVASYGSFLPMGNGVEMRRINSPEPRFWLYKSPLYKGWLAITEYGHFGGLPDDLGFVYQLNERRVEEVDATHPNYLKGFLQEALMEKQQNGGIQNRKDYALLLVNESYQDRTGLPSRSGSIRSVAQLGELLKTTFGFEVELIENPTRAQTEQKLRDYFKKEYGSDDQLFVLFSGYGRPDPDYEEDGYWVPADGSPQAGRVDTWMAHQDMLRRIDNIPCNHILLLADADYSDRMANYGQLRTQAEEFDRNAWMHRGKTDEEYLAAKLADRSRIFYTLQTDTKEKTEPIQTADLIFDLQVILKEQHTDKNFLSIGFLAAGAQGRIKRTSLIGDFGKGLPTGNFIFVRKASR